MSFILKTSTAYGYPALLIEHVESACGIWVEIDIRNCRSIEAVQATLMNAVMSLEQFVPEFKKKYEAAIESGVVVRDTQVSKPDRLILAEPVTVSVYGGAEDFNRPISFEDK